MGLRPSFSSSTILKRGDKLFADETTVMECKLLRQNTKAQLHNTGNEIVPQFSKDATNVFETRRPDKTAVMQCY